MPTPTDLQGEFVINNNTLEHEAIVPVPENTTAAPSTPAPQPHTSSKAGIFSNLCLYPDNVKFETQEENETIILLVRRDLITNLPWILAAIILILIPPVLTQIGYLFTPFFNPSAQVVLIITLFYYLIVFGFILVQFSLWYFTVGLVTDKRVIDMDLSGILSKDVSETRLNLIEDVHYSQVGSIRTIFNFGDVFMQTAGTNENFVFDRVPEPARIVRIIGDLIGGPR